MIDGFTNAQIIAALIAVLAASYAAFFGWLVMSINRLDGKIEGAKLHRVRVFEMPDLFADYMGEA